MIVDWATRNSDRNNYLAHTRRNINYKDIAIVDAGNIKQRPNRPEALVKGSGAFGGS
jgi:hypothetical protein